MAQVKAGPIKKKVSNLNTLAGRLSRAVEDLEDDELVDTVEIKPDAEGMMDPLEELLELIPDSATSELGDFFTNVGQSIVAAQSQLDLASKEYNLQLQDSDDHELVPPTTFRLPKASASFKFAMSSASSRGFNVFLASARDVQKRAAEQEVSFDIVAAPPSPEVMAKWAEREKGPKLSLVRGKVERGEVERLFVAADRGTTGHWAEQENLTSVLILREKSPGDTVSRQWHLLYVGQQGDGSSAESWVVAVAVLAQMEDLEVRFTPVKAGTSVKRTITGQILVAMASLLNDLLPE